MIITGIDYSISSPCICIFEGDNFNYQDCKFYFLSDRKKLHNKYNNIIGFPHPVYNTQEERFDNISSWAIDKCKESDLVIIENYSFGSTGMVFHIGENVGLLKHKLFTNKINYQSIPPTVIKKYATGKGNANKYMMIDKFTEIENINIREELSLKENNITPTSDIIDSYWICKYGYHNYTDLIYKAEDK